MASTMFVITLMATLAVLVNAGPSRGSYCNLKSCDGPKHTVCKYAFLRTSGQCGTVKSSTLTDAEIQELLKSHNQYRAKVANGQESRGNPGPQPAAANLGPLQWDQELADIAQTWADQCNYGHDECRDVERYKVGQNVAYKGTTGPHTANLSELVTMWYEEVELFANSQVDSVTDFNGVGHYTQMMWAETTHVGCGAVRYNADGVWNKTYLVCNYGPAGNWYGEAMYKRR